MSFCWLSLKKQTPRRDNSEGSLSKVSSIRLAFRELESFSGPWLPGFLSFYLARISSQMPGPFQWDPELCIHFFQCPGKTVPDGSGLSRSTTSGNINGYVNTVRHLNGYQRRGGCLLLLLGLAVICKFATVYQILPGPFLDPDTSRTGLSATGSDKFSCV